MSFAVIKGLGAVSASSQHLAIHTEAVLIHMGIKTSSLPQKQGYVWRHSKTTGSSYTSSRKTIMKPWGGRRMQLASETVSAKVGGRGGENRLQCVTFANSNYGLSSLFPHPSIPSLPSFLCKLSAAGECDQGII